MTVALPSLPLVAPGTLAQKQPPLGGAKDAFRMALQQRLAVHSCLTKGKEGNTREGTTAISSPKPLLFKTGEGQSRRLAGRSSRPSSSVAIKEGKLKASAAGALDKGEKTDSLRESIQSQTGVGERPELPPALTQLLEWLGGQPGESLKVPPERYAEIALWLVGAGFSPEQAEQLLFSPRVQEHGLGAADLLAFWQGTVSSPAPAALKGSQSGDPASSLASEARLAITSSREYQQRWERLRLPAAALPELKLELQRLGVSPQDISALEKQCRPNGLPLTEVWQLLERLSLQDGFLTEPAGAETVAHRLSGDELAGWQKLLEAAGLEPPLARGLLGEENPASMAALTDTLLKVGPTPSTMETLKDPKPLYLPENLRLRTVAWQADHQEPYPQETGQQDPEFFSHDHPDQTFTFARFQFAATNAHDPGLAAATGQTPPGTLGVTGSLWGGTSGNAASVPYLASEVRYALWSQIQAGIVSHLKEGISQVVLNLEPPELGQVHLTLNLSEQQVMITAITSRPEVAELAQAEVAQLIKALSQHGLILADFQVRPQESWTEAPSAGNLARREENPREKAPSRVVGTKGKVDRFV